MHGLTVVAALLLAVTEASGADLALDDRLEELAEVRKTNVYSDAPSTVLDEHIREARKLIEDGSLAGREDIVLQAYEILTFIHSTGIRGAVTDRALIELALDDLESPSAYIRNAALTLLARRADSVGNVVDSSIASMIEDPCPDICAEALRAVNGHRIRVEPPRLARFLADPDDAMRAFYARTWRRPFGSETRTDVVRDIELLIRREAMVARARAGSLADDIRVYPALGDTGRMAALMAMAHAGSEAPLDELRDETISRAVLEFAAKQARWLDGRDATDPWRSDGLLLAIGTLGGLAAGGGDLGLVHSDTSRDALALVGSIAQGEDRAHAWSEKAREVARFWLAEAHRVREGREREPAPDRPTG